ncbi:hypothetical protein Vi05172_g10917 [Venturia inaequalis]|nr:hypothetical protein Vi05172_g10917 [Venturia inaequalis]
MTKHATKTCRSTKIRKAEENIRFPYQDSLDRRLDHQRRKYEAKIADEKQKLADIRQELTLATIQRNIAVIEQHIERHDVAAIEGDVCTCEHNIETATVEQDIAIEELSIEIPKDEHDSTTADEQNIPANEHDDAENSQNITANPPNIVQIEKLFALLLISLITYKYYGAQALIMVLVPTLLLEILYQKVGGTGVLVAVAAMILVCPWVVGEEWRSCLLYGILLILFRPV